MPISSVNRAKSIAVPLNATSGGQVITVYESSGLTIGSELTPGYKIISYNCFIKNLKAFSQITSLPEVALPDFEITDSETTKLYKVIDSEWKSPRKQLNLFIAIDDNWRQVGSISILNPSGYPFRVYSLLDLFTDNLHFELGENGKIGVQIENAGYGLLVGGDSIVIHGSYVEEIFVEFPEKSIIVNVSGSSNQPPAPSPSEEDEEMSSWIIKAENYTAIAKDKILIDTRATPDIAIKVPQSPVVGDTFKVLMYGIHYAAIDFNGAKFNSSQAPQAIIVPSFNLEYTLIYFGEDVGWTGDLPGSQESQ